MSLEVVEVWPGEPVFFKSMIMLLQSNIQFHSEQMLYLLLFLIDNVQCIDCGKILLTWD